MTNERAIELLKRISDSQFDGPHGDERREALEMAVRALFSQQIVNDSQGLVNDCISRKMVMKEFSDFVRKSNNSDFAPTPTWNDAVSLVGSMPSAQFATDIKVGDTISRQQAIEVVEEYADRLQMVDWKENPCVPYKVHALNWCINSLRELPSVQPVNYGSTKSDSSSQLKLNNDLISRKQVLNASHFVACWDGVEHFSLEVVDADFIQKLPSVQPTQSNAQSTQCNTLDCVSREAVLDAIDKYILGKPEGCNIEVRELLKLITKVYHMPIYRIPSAQPHWIPCSVRMPEDGRRVLFQMTNGYIDVLRFNATGITTHLVAWMPLPKPYGGESND